MVGKSLYQAHTIRAEWVVFLSLFLALSILTFRRNLYYKDELTLWTNVLGHSPHKWRPHFKVGFGLYREKGLYDKAIAEFKTALKLKPDSPDILNNMGVIYQRKGLIDKAIDVYSQAIDMGSKWSSPYVNLGTVYLGKGDPLTALKWFKMAIKIDPYDAVALANAGFAYSDMEDYTNAIEMHKTALLIKPSYRTAHYGLGIAYEGIKDYRMAIYHWQEYIRMAPKEDGWRRDAERHIRRLSKGIGYEKRRR